jgi:high-affinity K+ transport system ATPase subunit B
MVMSFSNVRVRSSFLILVKKFRVLGEMVGVTGDGTNDDPVLKKVHVWFFEHDNNYTVQ